MNAAPSHVLSMTIMASEPGSVLYANELVLAAIEWILRDRATIRFATSRTVMHVSNTDYLQWNGRFLKDVRPSTENTILIERNMLYPSIAENRTLVVGSCSLFRARSEFRIETRLSTHEHCATARESLG